MKKGAGVGIIGRKKESEHGLHFTFQNLCETIISTCICIIRMSDNVSLIIAILTAYHTAEFYY